MIRSPALHLGLLALALLAFHLFTGHASMVARSSSTVN